MPSPVQRPPALAAIKSRTIPGSHSRAATASPGLGGSYSDESKWGAGRETRNYERWRVKLGAGDSKFRGRSLKPALDRLCARILVEFEMSSKVQHFAPENLVRVRKFRSTPASVLEFESQRSALRRQRTRGACLCAKITSGIQLVASRDKKLCDKLGMFDCGKFKDWSPFSATKRGSSGNGPLSTQQPSQADDSARFEGRTKVRLVYPDNAGENENYDAGALEAVLVLAGGQLPGGGVPIWVERRLDLAAQIQRLHGPTCTIVLSGGGTPYKPPQLTPEGYVIHESASCVDYLRAKGVESSVMVKEWGSYDTIGNGYLSLTQHVIPLGWKRIAVVTSAFHMPRSRAVFEWIFGLKGAGMGLRQRMGYANQRPGAPAGGSRGEGFILEYHAASDAGIDQGTIKHRLSKEQRSLQNLQPLIHRLNTLPEFHFWFHAEHKAYNIRDQGMFGREKLDDPALLSY